MKRLNLDYDQSLYPTKRPEVKVIPIHGKSFAYDVNSMDVYELGKGEKPLAPYDYAFWCEHDVMPVVACERSLRFPLLRIVERFDPRVSVLSYTELSPELRLVDAGLVRDWSLTKGRDAEGRNESG